MSRKWIVITTINEPTEAIIKYANLPDWEVVVIGDVKTPQSWLKNNLKLHYLSVSEQESTKYRIAKLLPHSSYMRKIIGYLYAIERGADIIVDTDDDNIPTGDWENQWDINGENVDVTNEKWVNTYALHGAINSWPRGIPLTTISTKRIPHVIRDNERKYEIGLVQGLADGDPDVDAIYRLTDNTPIIFSKRDVPLVLAHESWTPINSQNTMFIRKFFPLLYLPSTVTFRSTDIVRGFVAQPIIWKNNYNIAVVNAGVVQKRNPHNYLDDFSSEIPIFLHAEKISQTVLESITQNDDMTGDMVNAYEALRREKIVAPEELDRLEAWILDVQEALRK